MDTVTADPPSRTGIPLLDAVLDVAKASYEQGEAYGRGDTDQAEALHARVLTALAEVQRLWRQLDIEVNRTRTSPGAPVAVYREGHPSPLL
ncbi:hypothetical protein RB614_40505 [Phytohabitans sp. ZYX-F-186]|uniref:Uncharacterized protein n=1 Tax=Phytohabitans maris TaxID=3071409 RepID=A0ABU0ZXT2_9ACTN|nr:hypothetical protein [Phytohabitans sp. ZYX-F-186]MDQ7910792.1 hypothetical protein [Phytohabitans sp. ZYX-F-186]